MSKNSFESSETKNITMLRDRLVTMFDELRAGELEAKDLVEVNNTAGKIISACKVQLAYHALRQESPHIDFIHGDTVTVPHTMLGNQPPALPTQS